MQNLEIEQETVAQMADGAGAEYHVAVAKELVTDLFSLLVSKVPRHADIYDEVITKTLMRTDNPRQRL
jgi:hypothetical protein